MPQESLLKMTGIEKRFPGVHALKSVNFEVAKGEVHALMGENGAGKSTLIKVLTGIYAKDDGEIRFDGRKISPKTSLEAQDEGISTIYQELNLIPYQTVYENIFLGREPVKNGILDRKKMAEESRRILGGMGISLDVSKPLLDYSTAIQQMVAIARAITINCKLVVMDEPTSSLDTKEVQVLFDVIKKLKEKEISVIFISHRLDEIFKICDRVTVLKDGSFVGCKNVSEIDKLSLVSMMIGRESKVLERTKSGYDFTDKETLLKAGPIHSGVRLNGIDIDVKRGEVLGLAGLLGSGRSELAKVIFGSDIPDTGEIIFANMKQSFRQPGDAIKSGMGFCTEDRKIEGIIPHLSVKENMTIALLPHISRFCVVNEKKQSEIVDHYIKKLGIKTPTPNQLVRNLSGGNQQKVLLARWMCMNPKLIILDEPTRGIDVGAKAEIEALIQELSSQGISILMISSEIDELERNCDRVVVMRDGKKMGELIDSEINQQNVMAMIASEHSFANAGGNVNAL